MAVPLGSENQSHFIGFVDCGVVRHSFFLRHLDRFRYFSVDFYCLKSIGYLGNKRIKTDFVFDRADLFVAVDLQYARNIIVCFSDADRIVSTSFVDRTFLSLFFDEKMDQI